MRLCNAVVTVLLLALTVLQLFIPKMPVLAIVYAAGALLAGISLSGNLSLRWARVLAGLTVVVMFFFFAAFFRFVESFHDQWYTGGMALDSVGMFLSAFAMIPVLSVYSCRMKAEPVEETQGKDAPAVGIPSSSGGSLADSR